MYFLLRHELEKRFWQVQICTHTKLFRSAGYHIQRLCQYSKAGHRLADLVQNFEDNLQVFDSSDCDEYCIKT